jgi:hypothetical protein
MVFYRWPQLEQLASVAGIALSVFFFSLLDLNVCVLDVPFL